MVKEKLNFNGRNSRPLLVILDFNLGITNYFQFQHRNQFPLTAKSLL